MNAIVCDQWGAPEDVLQVREVPDPTPGRGEVRVRMIASPINPSDLLMVRGEYGRQPPLPATPGFEGVGIVESGSGLLARRVMGRRVAVLNSGNGNWKDLAKWSGDGVPNAPDARAVLGTLAGSAARQITLDTNVRLESLTFDSPGSYTIAPSGGNTLTI